MKIQKRKIDEILHCLFLLNNFTNIPSENNPAIPGNVYYFNFFSERLFHHYNHHCDEKPPMLTVSEFMQSLNRNQLFIKIQVQRDNFVQLDFPFGNHIHFNNDSIRVSDCKISNKNCLIIIEGKKEIVITETGQEVKLFWGEKHFELLKDITLCNETITEFETLKKQTHTDRCVDINKLNTVFLVVGKKEAIELSDDKLKE